MRESQSPRQSSSQANRKVFEFENPPKNVENIGGAVAD